MKFKDDNGNIIYCKHESYNKKYDTYNFNCDKSISYYKGYLVHRENGPAIIWSNGDKNWYINGNLHREDGPAINWNFTKRWYLNGISYSEEEYYKIVSLIKKNEVLNDI